MIQVRSHTSPGGGHDNEVLSTNIEEALRNLKIDFESFDYENTPLPQEDTYFHWLKKQAGAQFNTNFGLAFSRN